MKRTERNLSRLLASLEDVRRLLVFGHDHPDPDALASGWVLRHILRNLLHIEVTLGYDGMVGRAENRAMVDLLRIPLVPLAHLDPSSFDAVALIDTQPQTGNNPLGDGLVPRVVIDHHPPRKSSRNVNFCDIRPEYGATATILWGYLKKSGLTVQPRYATGLFYAIRSETQNLGRESGGQDFKAFKALFPRVDNRIISRIENAPISRRYLGLLEGAFQRTRLYGNVSLTMLEQMPYPDVPAELADLLLRVDEVEWALVGGVHGRQLYLSIRTSNERAHAARLLGQIVGDLGRTGGHSTMAGGRIDLYGKTKKAEAIRRLLVSRAREVLGAGARRGRRLVRGQPCPQRGTKGGRG